ncbi:MAG: glycogen synthase GlgA [Ruminococcus flavefaciens]|nr:glycogen synthase GlgA [Ruminococcus flavefaciens]MCM1229628.1 glycogen synthase GlgA [Ruminococcus flavefaciens]
MKNILFAASECVPFIKTGGLADVVGALPQYINKNEFDVRVIMPYYTCIPAKFRDNFKYVTHFYMDYGLRQNGVHVGIMEYEYNGIKFYFVDNEYYFKCDSPYSADLKWDIERFTFFCKAVLAILPVIGFRPDIIHCHDWQASLIPVFLHSTFATNPFYSSTKSIMTIHNLKFQGVWNIDTFKYNTALPGYMFTPDKLEFNKDANMLKGGLVYADYITTVSETYAEEIKYPFFGEQLDGLLRARSASLRGIVNGIDYKVFDPSNDKQIFAEYSVKNFKKKKAENKEKLQAELGLPVDKDKYMVAIISRLTDQKGLDLVNCVMERICDPNTQFVVVGTGEQRYEDMFRHYQWKYPERVSANILYSDALAHKLYAAADAMLMPSLFEPCGLTQLISLRYGTVPIVRETGGLKDTVQPYNEFDGTGTGFSFKNYNADEMLGVINYSKSVYYDHRHEWDEMVKRGMEADFSWGSSALQYEGMYSWMINW